MSMLVGGYYRVLNSSDKISGTNENVGQKKESKLQMMLATEKLEKLCFITAQNKLSRNYMRANGAWLLSSL